MKNNIILITDNGNITKKLQDSVLLLRENDYFESVRTINCFENIKTKNPTVIFYHLSKTIDEFSTTKEEDFFNFLSKIKQNKNLKDTSVILLYDNLNEETLCIAFEKGISDFISIHASDTEFTIRTLWCMQKKNILADNEKKTSILLQQNILDKNNEVFTEKYTHSILKEESLKNWGTFVVIAPDINIRSKISPHSLMATIKTIVRNNDILGFASDFKIYLWFRETKKEDVLKILEKIKTCLTKAFTISAGFIEIKNIEFDVAEEIANEALKKALLIGDTFICAKDTDKKFPEVENNPVKNYKSFKEKNSKKLENLLSPLFYQIQRRIEEKIFETKIEQEVTKEKSLFILKNKYGKSSFIISYSGLTKAKIETVHEIKNKKHEKEISFIDLENITEKIIEKNMENFINKFKNYTNS